MQLTYLSPSSSDEDPRVAYPEECLISRGCLLAEVRSKGEIKSCLAEIQDDI
jgi:hypothetical protein